MQPSTIVMILLFAFILYRIYLRVRRSVGWQQLKTGKMQLMTAISFLIGLIFLIEGASHPISLISDALGILMGVILAYYGAVMTRIEQRNGHWNYRPNTWIGSLVTAMFLGRIIYRIYQMYEMGTQGGPGPAAASRLASLGYDANSPWTSGLLLIMFAYFVTYYTLLLRKQKRLPQFRESN